MNGTTGLRIRIYDEAENQLRANPGHARVWGGSPCFLFDGGSAAQSCEALIQLGGADDVPGNMARKVVDALGAAQFFGGQKGQVMQWTVERPTGDGS